MGPDLTCSFNFITKQRPYHMWDIRTVRGTDVVGSQEHYSRAVEKWSIIHERLPDAKSNKIQKNLRGVCLHAQICGRAGDTCKVLTNGQLRQGGVRELICSLLYQRDTIYEELDVLCDLNALINSISSNNKSVRNYKPRFSAHVAKFNAKGNSVQLPESVYDLPLLLNTGVDDSQRLSVLSTATSVSDTNSQSFFKISPLTNNTATFDDPSSNTVTIAATANGTSNKDAALAAITTTNSIEKITFEMILSNAAFMDNVSYDTVAAVIRQCDTAKGGHRTDTMNTKYASMSFQRPFTQMNKWNKQHNRNRHTNLTPEQLPDLKSKSKYRACGKFGDWPRDHMPDGSTRQEAGRSSNNAVNNKTTQQSTLQFGMEFTTNEAQPVQPSIGIMNLNTPSSNDPDPVDQMIQ